LDNLIRNEKICSILVQELLEGSSKIRPIFEHVDAVSIITDNHNFKDQLFYTITQHVDYSKISTIQPDQDDIQRIINIIRYEKANTYFCKKESNMNIQVDLDYIKKILRTSSRISYNKYAQELGPHLQAEAIKQALVEAKVDGVDTNLIEEAVKKAWVEIDAEIWNNVDKKDVDILDNTAKLCVLRDVKFGDAKFGESVCREQRNL
jgi:hypothetical protein